MYQACGFRIDFINSYPILLRYWCYVKHRRRWKLKLNGGNGRVVDYSGFGKGEGVVQSPGLSKRYN
jgi:hypothetical protein